MMEFIFMIFVLVGGLVFSGKLVLSQWELIECYQETLKETLHERNGSSFSFALPLPMPLPASKNAKTWTQLHELRSKAHVRVAVDNAGYTGTGVCKSGMTVEIFFPKVEKW
jgi:hypothetical protein